MTVKKTCNWCPDPPERGGSLCKECKKKAREYREKLKAERIKKGECYRCGHALSDEDKARNMSSCSECRKKDLARKPRKQRPSTEFVIPQF